MAKFNMNDYAKYLEKEEMQERLQTQLEVKNEEEYWETNYAWHDWQRQQEQQKYEEELAQYDYEEWPEFDSEDDACYDPDCEDDDLDSYDPFDDLLDFDVPYDYERDHFFTAEDISDMYADVETYQDESCYEPENADPLEDELYATAQEFSDDAVEEEKVRRRKAISRNRHLSKIKAKERANRCAEITDAKFWKLYSDVTSHKEANYYRHHCDKMANAFKEVESLEPNGLRKLYYRRKSMNKKSSRVKPA